MGLLSPSIVMETRRAERSAHARQSPADSSWSLSPRQLRVGRMFRRVRSDVLGSPQLWYTNSMRIVRSVWKGKSKHQSSLFIQSTHSIYRPNEAATKASAYSLGHLISCIIELLAAE